MATLQAAAIRPRGHSEAAGRCSTQLPDCGAAFEGVLPLFRCRLRLQQAASMAKRELSNHPSGWERPLILSVQAGGISSVSVGGLQRRLSRAFTFSSEPAWVGWRCSRARVQPASRRAEINKNDPIRPDLRLGGAAWAPVGAFTGGGRTGRRSRHAWPQPPSRPSPP